MRIYYVVSDFISIKSRTYVLKTCDETLVVERAYVLRRCVTHGQRLQKDRTDVLP